MSANVLAKRVFPARNYFHRWGNPCAHGYCYSGSIGISALVRFLRSLRNRPIDLRKGVVVIRKLYYGHYSEYLLSIDT